MYIQDQKFKNRHQLQRGMSGFPDANEFRGNLFRLREATVLITLESIVFTNKRQQHS